MPRQNRGLVSSRRAYRRWEGIGLMINRHHRRSTSVSSLSSTSTVGRFANGSSSPASCLETIVIDDVDVIDLTIDDETESPNLSEERSVASIRHNNETLHVGNLVEVWEKKVGDYEVDFLQIDRVIQSRDQQQKTWLQGIPFIRNRNMRGMLPNKPNEVCRIEHIVAGGLDPSPILMDVPLNKVGKVRSLIFTNALWPQFRSSELANTRRHAEYRPTPNDSTLVCRWKFKIYSIPQGRSKKPVEEVFETISVTEVDNPRHRVEDYHLSQQWRGGVTPGGAWAAGDTLPKSAEHVDITPRRRGQKYTVLDAFSGAGGLSRGAQSAGFKITHAIDKSDEETSVHDFIRYAEGQHIRVDILHLSPPCQYFSPAHTHPSIHDDENIFALYSCNALIDKVRPRIITVEQTFGLPMKRHEVYFHGFLNDFTQYGYSVRWKIVRLCTWGLAQDRRRLIMIAAAPGEKLPPFPKPTHSDVGGQDLKRYNTIKKAIAGLRPTDDLHDLARVKRFYPPKGRYDPNKLSRTITTGGADFVYFDGTRDFTLREFACLQGFPMNHEFIGGRTAVKRQIGNAFAPNTVKVLYQHIEKWLLKEDKKIEYQPALPDIVLLDDDLDSDSSHTSYQSSSSPEPEMMDLTEDVMIIDTEETHRSQASSRRVRSARSRIWDNEDDVDAVMIDLT
ncbi:S-adenosyl-L-methionine-dependent methyltransferase [Emericellopsis atlantica]|uniref:DNA (cytosine-5-)-methyltransferase n=1 Tax=Emericellopsis atlantica TaxID=2614577 RepID=A0A9P7ZUW5_9HYPO|nr:S-adenosyl-L-methionine-dependent methyltransferase [Emericellopsis atlantica]KAG9258670.1 S-adenosyl-L-methionine-dependent methyltransferase [Emericellopsis atlantica]